jgi:SAM-dependent methyltransferase
MNMRRELSEAASAPFRAAGPYAYHFARGKLAGDPIFGEILARGLLATRTRILDLGCGQGLLAAWLLAARRRHGAGGWPENWPVAPDPVTIRGIEIVRRHVLRARRALGNQAEFVIGDLRTADFGSADGIVILDVLHYIDYADHERILRRVHAALAAGGVLLLRVGDAGGGLGFTISKWVDQIVALIGGRGLIPVYCRSVPEWQELLALTGFDSEALPVSAGTPFANVLLIAKPR